MAIVIGHRGAPGYRPEHTLESYALAARMGADYIEPDLVPTRDGVLVARHENEISGTTDVARHAEFADRRTTKTIDGAAVTGWFTEDFTLAELRTLRATERIPELRPRNTDYDGRFAVPTLAEVIELRRSLSSELGREVGIYPETKHPAYFRSLGLPLEEPLVEALRESGLDSRTAPVFVQSFEPDSLKAIGRELDVRLVQLVGTRAGPPFDLGEIARYAHAVGPSKVLVLPRDADGASRPPTSFVSDAHRAGLLVHPYTFRDENAFLPLELRSGTDPAGRGDAAAEYERFLALGVDGVFSDHADTAVEAFARGGPRA
jgi:glycerophosphoryl diester phosphodiesterase